MAVEGSAVGPSADATKLPPPSILLHHTCISSTGPPKAEKFYCELRTIANL